MAEGDGNGEGGVTIPEVEEVKPIRPCVPWVPTLWVEPPRMKVGLKVMMCTGTKTSRRSGGLTKALEAESNEVEKLMV